jgi:hypothetical protein
VYGLRPYTVYLFISGAFGLFFKLYAGMLVLGYLTAEVMGRRLDVSSVSVAARALFVLDALTLAGIRAALAVAAITLSQPSCSTRGPSATAPEKETEDASEADKQRNFVNSDKNYRSSVDEQPSDA